MGLTGHQEAMELLLIEEADAWFEYLEATRAQSTAPVRRGRALGLGASLAAAACDPGPSRQAPSGRRSRLTRR